MIDKVKQLRDKFRTATEEEKERIETELKALNQENPEAFAQAMLACMKETNENLEKLLVREQLKDILPFISVSFIAKNYFSKSKEWFYQRINGNIVNGKPAQFTEREKEILNFALHDLSKKIGSVRVV
ncbi:DUF5053 domain-containing protein [Ornithobacterium rhinotracheale]|uniref:DUF5053 domain-containing protein n=1 Tax=Ornithobacterium rhinotracheale TaxID=28251 RepID=UPI00129C50E3|nr:DUF5053 domain-containing protein [Ornithobacterium rhinotracheale]MRJ09088.1 DUF5053 domain-containing protein [Ornithobacterium rhinotracheale]UOH77859.1 DUF5053 domain-containing protein [Ornithobacterium rhinotracheale]